MNWYVSPNMINELSFIAKLYFNSILKKCATYVNPEDKVLDFGCGQKRLKKFIGTTDYVGYDILEDYSDLKEYPNKKFDVVISNHCLEHMTPLQLEEFISYIEQFPPRLLVISLPLENKLSDVLGWIQGVYYNNKIEHQQSYRKVLNRLNQSFSLREINTIWFMTILTVWKVKK